MKVMLGQSGNNKRVSADRIKTQARNIDIIITALHEIYLRNFFMVDTRSNMKVSDLNYKPHGGRSLRDLIDLEIGVRFYPPQGSKNHKLPWTHSLSREFT